ncbi:MAG: S41 family peptidase [Gilvibacter sp.]
MRKIFILGLLICMSFTTTAQDNNVKTAFDSIYNHISSASVYRANVDWSKVKPKVYDLAKDATAIEDLAPAIEYLLEALDDGHGKVIYRRKFLAYYVNSKPHLKDFDNELYNKIQYVQEYPFKAENINGIGYIRIVGLPMGDNQKMAKDIQDRVCELVADGVKNWIIDLRYNGGGNMNPMVEGITAILKDNGNVGGAKGLTPDEDMLYRIEDDSFYNGGYSISLEEDCAVEEAPKIGVMLSNYTASSGEALAAILKKRPKTRFFGGNSYGLTTATNWYPVNDSLFVTISTQHFMDREGVIYKDYIPVDHELPFTPTNDVNSDASIMQVIKWLQEK